MAGEAIHFGLAAIKNVGATAIESIVRTREADGRFASLDDFCARVDLRLVNRRVVECLIKAGAFDSLQSTRAGLLAALDQAMDGGQRQQRDREEGQVSLFDVLGGGGATPAATPSAAAARVPEWPQEEMLGYEQEVLGFYLSGHPLEQHREMARRIGALSAARAGRALDRRARAAAGAGERASARARPRAATAWRSPRSSWWTAACP